MDKIIYSGSPHIRSNNSTRKIMLDVVIALAPACIVGCIFFGWNALWILLLSVVSSVLSEAIFELCCKKSFKQIIEEFDFTSVITGILIGMNFPAFSDLSLSWYIPILSGIFAIVIVKMLFGGTGKNLFNPAIAGRLFAIMSFGALMNEYVFPNVTTLSGEAYYSSITTSATPLTQLLGGTDILQTTNLSVWDLLLGTGLQGTIGETCKLALLVGGIYLVIKKVIHLEYPLIYIAVTGLFTVALKGFDFSYFLPSILTGGLILGAIFMATDYVTTPNSRLGNIIYFVFLGLLTAGLRVACSMEVTSFAIMLGNCIVPLIDMYIIPKPFGQKKAKQKEGGGK